MKYQIDIFSIDHGAGIFATPTYGRTEYVEVKAESNLHKYIINHVKDDYGHPMKKDSKKFMGYDYVSHAGGCKVKRYKPPKRFIPKFKSI